MQANGIGRGFHPNIKYAGDDIVYSMLKNIAVHNRTSIRVASYTEYISLQYANKLEDIHCDYELRAV